MKNQDADANNPNVYCTIEELNDQIAEQQHTYEEVSEKQNNGKNFIQKILGALGRWSDTVATLHLLQIVSRTTT